ncbi:MAG TPA: N-acetylneuraminate synthase family protein, partial [Bacteroidales bacterium]
MKLGNVKLNDYKPLYFIADIAANHDGDINRAFKLIELAKEAGADAAKFQNFVAEKIVSKKGFEELKSGLSHQKNWGKPVFEIYKDASVSYDWTPLLKKKCDEVGIEYFTSPYDFESIEAVDPYVNLYKIGSGDITWIEIIEYIAKKGKPVIIASGASTLEDVERAMVALKKITKDIVLMQCNTNYTASVENFKYINLNVLKIFVQKYPEVVLGLSDHTPGHATVLGAVALGARVFEKHFTDDNSRSGPDHKFAMNPATWRDMVERANEVYLALGDGKKVIEENEKETSILQRRSLRFTKN